MNLRTVFRFMLILLFLVSATYAQTIMTTLTGTVTDPSGATVVDAKVTLKNSKSGDIRRTTTNSDGYFTFVAVPAGEYGVMVEFGGFATWERTGIVLNSGDKRNVNAMLALATAVQQVEVSATASDVAVVDSGERSSLVTGKQIENLSIVGRNATEFLKILPGFAMGANSMQNKPQGDGQRMGMNQPTPMSGNSVNGSTPDITMDGSHTTDPGTTGAVPVYPNADMIAELRVLTSNFSAENAKGPVVVSSVSKSGGADFHGEGYLYTRNSAMNAADWENNAFGQPKPPSSYYYPGGNVGGPLVLPFTNFNRNRDKVFFFSGFEYYKQTPDAGVIRAFVPTEKMRTGDFSELGTFGAIVNQTKPTLGGPVNNPAAPDNQVPKNLIDPAGQMLINMYPLPNVDPNTNGGMNYAKAVTTDANSYQWMNRVDVAFSDNTKLYVKYNLQREANNSPLGLWVNAGDNRVPSPTNIIGKYRSDNITSSLTHVFSPTMTNEAVFGYTFIHFPNTPEDPSKLQRSELGYPYKGAFGSSTSIPAVGSWGGPFPTLGTVFGFDPDFSKAAKLWNFADNLAKVVGTHTLKFGAYFETTQNGQHEWQTDAGFMRFENYYTVSGNNYADLLMGVGFQGYNETKRSPATDMAYRTLAFYAQDSWKVTRRLTLELGMRFDHVTYPSDRTGIGLAIFDKNKRAFLWNKIDSSVPMSGGKFDPLFYSPRLGMAYDVFGTGKTVLRGGIGWFRTPDALADNYGGAWSTARGSLGWSCSSPNCPSLAGVDEVHPGTSIGAPTGGVAIDPNDKTIPVTRSYSFTINQRLPKSVMWEIAYVGSSSHHLTIPKLNINAVPLGTAPLGTTLSRDLFRPYQGFGDITVTAHPEFFRSNYNSLQTSLSRQIGRVNLTANYTWSKSMGIRSSNGNNGNEPGILSDYGAAWKYGVQANNRAHVFNVAYSVNLPEFAKSNAAAKLLANGWQISGITILQSGADIPTNASSWGAPGNALQLLGGDGTVAPVMLCDPRSGLGPNQFFNSACIGPTPTDGTLGTGAWPYIPGPAFMNHDLSVFKHIKFTESKNLEFRVSAFNFLNHPLTSFRGGDPNLSINFDGDGRITNPRFGYADYKYGHRVMQLGVKFHF